MTRRSGEIPFIPQQWWQTLRGESAVHFSHLVEQCAQKYHPDLIDWELVSVIPGRSTRLVRGAKTDSYITSVRAAAAQVDIDALHLRDAFLGKNNEYQWEVGGVGRRRGKLAEITPDKLYVDPNAVSIYRRRDYRSEEIHVSAEENTAFFDAIANYLRPQIAIPVLAQAPRLGMLQ